MIKENAMCITHSRSINLDIYIHKMIDNSIRSGFHNKTPLTGWFKQQDLIFSQYWRLEALDQGDSMVGFRRRLSYSPADGQLIVSSHGGRGGRASSFMYLLKRALSP